MSDPGRPSAGKRHGSSWARKLHSKHDAKYHDSVQGEEVEPLLVEEGVQSEAESHEHHHRHCAPLRTASKIALNAILAFFRICVNVAIFSATFVFNGIRRNYTTILAAAAILLTISTLGLGLGWAIDHKQHKSVSFCTSEDCNHASKIIVQNMAPNFTEIDPCVNFEKYACGGFEDHHKLRPDQSDSNTLSIMAEDNQLTLRKVLEKGVDRMESKDQANFKKLKSVYDACMDEKSIEELGLKPLKTLVENVKSTYPVSSPSQLLYNSQVPECKSRHAVSDITAAVSYMSRLGIESILSLGVGADDKNPEDQVIFASPPYRIGLPSKEYYENGKILADYQSVISSVLPHFYETSNDSYALGHNGVGISMSDMVKKLVAFEVKLAGATPSEEDREDIHKTYNPKTTCEMEQLMPQVSFEKVLRELAPPGYTAPYVIVSSPSYMQNASEIMEATPRAIIQAHLVWKTVQEYASRIEDPVMKPLNRFTNELQGKEPDAREERWRTCIRASDSTLGWILSKFFVDEAFSPKAKQFGDLIIDDIKASFVALLRDASWMDSDVRKIAEKKVAAIDKKIGYPVSNPDILDADALQKYYKALHVSKTSHFDNKAQSAQFETKLEWAKLGKPTRHDEWGMTAPTVNAYYNPAGNEIVFPAGIMQSPVFYNPAAPQYLSYGSFGSVAGHELSHAFDNNGAEYDETGRLKKWWTKETKEAFDNKTICFVDQYSKYTVDGPGGKKLHVNGKLTLGENIADAGGVHAAFKAWTSRGRPGQILPALANFTKEQVFFLSYANAWCGINTKESAAQRIYLDPHSPKPVRILGTMANSADFREAFKCESKKPTCELW